jgi:hypothetical protein
MNAEQTQNFVRQRVHEDSEVGDEIVAARDHAVKVVRQRRGAEEQQGEGFKKTSVHKHNGQERGREDKSGDG